MATGNYVTSLAEESLANSRVIVVSDDLLGVDSGPQSTYNIQTTGILNSLNSLTTNGILCSRNNLQSAASRIIANSSTTTATNPDGVAGNINVNVTNSTSLQNIQLMLNNATLKGVIPTSYINFKASSSVDITVQNGNNSGQVTQDISIAQQADNIITDSTQYLLASANSALPNAQVLTPATGAIVLGQNSTTWGTLTIGTNDTVLTSNGTTASWQVLSNQGANEDGYYVVTQAANAPVNADSLSDVGSGLLYSTVNGGVATLGTAASTSEIMYFGAGNPVRIGASTGAAVSALDVTGDRASFWIDDTANAPSIPNAGGVLIFNSSGSALLTTSIANNKTGQLVVNASGATNTGDIIVGNANGVMQSLAIGANGAVLTSNGTNPQWKNTLNYGFNLTLNTGVGFGIIYNIVKNLVTATTRFFGSSAFNALISNVTAPGNLFIRLGLRTIPINFSGTTAENWCFFRLQSNLSPDPTADEMTSNYHGCVARSGTTATLSSLTGINLNVPVADIAVAGSSNLILYVYTTSTGSVSTFALDYPTNVKCTYYPNGLL